MTIERKELVIDRTTGRIRQAGADGEGAFVEAERRRCEQDLYYFCRTVLDMWWLYPPLHVPVCRWLQKVPPRMKGLLMPRNHCKSTLVAQALPLHMLIQPAMQNAYFPTAVRRQNGLPPLEGRKTRILMVGENVDRIGDHYRPIKNALESNELLRSWWPQMMWDSPKRDAPLWNNTELIVKRDDEFPDPSIRAIGVGGATTGAHPNVIIKDDLTTEKAANEPPTMQKALEWHKNSRALFEDPINSLEYLTFTRWAVTDLAGHILDNDPAVAVNTRWRTLIEDGKVLYPTKFGDDPEAAWQIVLDQYNQDIVMASLQYNNSVVQAGITDFAASDLRSFYWHGDEIVFDEIDADERLAQEIGKPHLPAVVPDLRGLPINDERVISATRMRYLRAVRSA